LYYVNLEPALQKNLNKADEFASDSVEMIDKFNDMVRKFIKYLETSKDLSEKVKLFLSLYSKRGSIYKGGKNYSDVKNTTIIYDIMEIFRHYSSFFNFELVEKAMDIVNYTNGITSMEKYKKDFKKYVQCRAIDFLPSGVGMKGNNHASVIIWLDDAYSDCELKFICRLKKDFSAILNIDPEHLQFHGVYTGSISVVFHILMVLKTKKFPLQEDQIESLKRMSYFKGQVLKIECDEYHYHLDASSPSKWFYNVKMRLATPFFHLFSSVY